MSYDAKVYELGRGFLLDDGNKSEEAADRLAQQIQDTIEDYIADLENGLEEE